MPKFRGKKQVLGFPSIYLREDGKYEGLLRTHQGKKLCTAPMETIEAAYAAREKLRAARAGGDDCSLGSNNSKMEVDDAAERPDGPYDYYGNKLEGLQHGAQLQQSWQLGPVAQGSVGPRSLLQQRLEKQQQQRYAQETAVWTDAHRGSPVLPAAERQENAYEPGEDRHIEVLQEPSYPGSHHHHYQEQQPEWHRGQGFAESERHAAHLQHNPQNHGMRIAGPAGNTNRIEGQRMDVAALGRQGHDGHTGFAAAGLESTTRCPPAPGPMTPMAFVPGTSGATRSLHNGRATPAYVAQLPGRNSLPPRGPSEVPSAYTTGRPDHHTSGQHSKTTAVTVPSEPEAAPMGPDGKPLPWEGPMVIPEAGRGVQWQLNCCTGVQVTMTNVFSSALWEYMQQVGLPAKQFTLELLEILGQGSYGAVYRAELRWPTMQTDAQAPSVAVKVFQPWDTRSLMKEVWGLGLCLPLKHVVDILALGEAKVLGTLITPDEGSEDHQQPSDLILPCLVMEWMPGGNLEGSYKWSEDEVRPIARDLVATLYDMQHMGLGSTGKFAVVHRDVKPMNCLRDDDGTIKLCDFGHCYVYDLSAAGPCMHSVHVGTTLYKSPTHLAEFLAGYGVEVDGYALGILMVSLLYGGWSEIKPLSSKLLVGGSREFSLYEFVTTRLALDTESPPLCISGQMRMFIADCCTRHLPEVLRCHRWLSMGNDVQLDMDLDDDVSK